MALKFRPVGRRENQERAGLLRAPCGQDRVCEERVGHVAREDQEPGHAGPVGPPRDLLVLTTRLGARGASD